MARCIRLALFRMSRLASFSLFLTTAAEGAFFVGPPMAPRTISGQLTRLPLHPTALGMVVRSLAMALLKGISHSVPLAVAGMTAPGGTSCFSFLVIATLATFEARSAAFSVLAVRALTSRRLFAVMSWPTILSFVLTGSSLPPTVTRPAHFS